MPRQDVINVRRVRLMRKHIPRVENVSTALIALGLVGVVVWAFGTRDDFDPQERDLPVELLYQEKPPIEIYHRPLKLWVEPGTVQVAGAFDFGAFPASVVDDQWQPAGRVRRFEASNLYEKINGEAEKFIKQGFVSLNYLLLRETDSGTEMAMELFDQGGLGGSLGIFAEHAAGREVSTEGEVTYFTTSAGVIGRAGQHFFRVAADRETPQVQDKARSLIQAFAELIGPAHAAAVPVAAAPAGAPAAASSPSALDEPEGFVLLRRGLDIPESGIQFEQSNVFQYDFAEAFWFGQAGIDDRARLFVHIADDEDAAGELAAGIAEEHGFEYEAVPLDEEWSLYRHKFTPSWFALARQGRYVYGAEKLPGPEAGEEIIRRIEQVLPRE